MNLSDQWKSSSLRYGTELLLYRSFEILPGTAGRFRLNAELPIPFDGKGHMDVALLTAEARLAIELEKSCKETSDDCLEHFEAHMKKHQIIETASRIAGWFRSRKPLVGGLIV